MMYIIFLIKLQWEILNLIHILLTTFDETPLYMRHATGIYIPPPPAHPYLACYPSLQIAGPRLPQILLAPHNTWGASTCYPPPREK